MDDVVSGHVWANAPWLNAIPKQKSPYRTLQTLFFTLNSSLCSFVKRYGQNSRAVYYREVFPGAGEPPARRSPSGQASPTSNDAIHGAARTQNRVNPQSWVKYPRLVEQVTESYSSGCITCIAAGKVLAALINRKAVWRCEPFRRSSSP